MFGKLKIETRLALSPKNALNSKFDGKLFRIFWTFKKKYPLKTLAWTGSEVFQVPKNHFRASPLAILPQKITHVGIQPL